MKYSKIIFVCTGNTCRSPMAEAVCRDIISKIRNDSTESVSDSDAWVAAVSGSKVPEVISRGLSVYSGDGINPLAEAALNEIGLSNRNHRAKQLSAEDFMISGAAAPAGSDVEASGAAAPAGSDVEASGAAAPAASGMETENEVLVITMTEAHKREVHRRFPEQNRVLTLKEMAGQSGDVADPYGGNKDIYSFCLLNIAGLISQAIKLNLS